MRGYAACGISHDEALTRARLRWGLEGIELLGQPGCDEGVVAEVASRLALALSDLRSLSYYKARVEAVRVGQIDWKLFHAVFSNTGDAMTNGDAPVRKPGAYFNDSLKNSLDPGRPRNFVPVDTIKVIGFNLGILARGVASPADIDLVAGQMSESLKHDKERAKYVDICKKVNAGEMATSSIMEAYTATNSRVLDDTESPAPFMRSYMRHPGPYFLATLKRFHKEAGAPDLANKSTRAAQIMAETYASIAEQAAPRPVPDQAVAGGQSQPMRAGDPPRQRKTSGSPSPSTIAPVAATSSAPRQERPAPGSRGAGRVEPGTAPTTPDTPAVVDVPPKPPAAARGRKRRSQGEPSHRVPAPASAMQELEKWLSSVIPNKRVCARVMSTTGAWIELIEEERPDAKNVATAWMMDALEEAVPGADLSRPGDLISRVTSILRSRIRRTQPPGPHPGRAGAPPDRDVHSSPGPGTSRPGDPGRPASPAGPGRSERAETSPGSGRSTGASEPVPPLTPPMPPRESAEIAEIVANRPEEPPVVAELPPQCAGALDRAMVDVRQAASMAGEPINAGPGELTQWQVDFLDSLEPEQRSSFDRLAPGHRSLLLEGLRSGPDRILEREVLRAIASRTSMAGPSAPPDSKS